MTKSETSPSPNTNESETSPSPNTNESKTSPRRYKNVSSPDSSTTALTLLKRTYKKEYALQE